MTDERVYNSAVLLTIRNLSELRRDLTKNHKRLVFTVGSYDLLHPGHGRYLAEARSHGDCLVVGIESNVSRRRKTGVKNHILDEAVRAEMVGSLRCVDGVVIVDEGNLLPVLRKLKPDVFYTIRTDWEQLRKTAESVLVKSYGGKVVRSLPFEPYVSSSGLVKKVAERKVFSLLKSALGVNIDLADGGGGPIRLGSGVPENLLGLSLKGETIKFESLARLRARLTGRRVVFTAGTYDLIHVGHARYLARARSLGDVLVVGLPSNSSVEKLKGRGRPLLDELARAETLTYLRSVDYVVIFDQPTILECLKALQPQVFFTVDESWNSGLRSSLEYKEVTSYGGEVVLAPRQSPYLSASLIINKAAGELVKEIFRECLDSAAKSGSLKEK